MSSVKLVVRTKDNQFKSGLPDGSFNGYGDRFLLKIIQHDLEKILKNYSNRNHGEHLSKRDKLYVRKMFCLTWELLKRMYPDAHSRNL